MYHYSEQFVTIIIFFSSSVGTVGIFGRNRPLLCNCATDLNPYVVLDVLQRYHLHK